MTRVSCSRGGAAWESQASIRCSKHGCFMRNWFVAPCSLLQTRAKLDNVWELTMTILRNWNLERRGRREGRGRRGHMKYLMSQKEVQSVAKGELLHRGSQLRLQQRSNIVQTNIYIYTENTEIIQLTRIVRYLQVFIISLNVNTVCHCLSCFINCSQHATVRRSVEGERVLDVLNTDEELQHSLETQTKPSSGSWALPPHVKIPVQTMITDTGESGCEAEVTMFSQTASTQLSHPGHQEIHSTHQTIISLITHLLTQYL